MHVDQIEAPKAWALIDQRTVSIYNYTSDKTFVILGFLNIPHLSSVLISKYENYTALEIVFAKTFCPTTKLQNLHKLSHLLKRLTNSDSTQIQNTFKSHDTHDLIKIQYNHYASNP